MPAATHETHSPPAPAAPGCLKVLIADDHPLIIAGIRRTIEHHDDMELVGEAHSGPELTRLIERRRPDIVLMDLRMPGVTGMEMIELIRRRWPQTKTIVLSACDDRGTIDAALQAGATAYVLKSAHTLDVASVLRKASSGAVFHAPALAVTRPVRPPEHRVGGVPRDAVQHRRQHLQLQQLRGLTPAR